MGAWGKSGWASDYLLSYSLKNQSLMPFFFFIFISALLQPFWLTPPPLPTPLCHPQVFSIKNGRAPNLLDVALHLLPITGSQLSAADVTYIQYKLPVGGFVPLGGKLVLRSCRVQALVNPGEMK